MCAEYVSVIVNAVIVHFYASAHHIDRVEALCLQLSICLCVLECERPFLAEPFSSCAAVDF